MHNYIASILSLVLCESSAERPQFISRKHGELFLIWTLRRGTHREPCLTPNNIHITSLYIRLNVLE